MVDLSRTIYTTPRVAWLSYIVGGFLFGFGMTLASGCGSKTLIRVGGGSLKSLVVLGSVLANWTHGGAATKLGFAVAVAVALAAFVFASPDFRASPELAFGGIVIGAVIVGGWYVSGHLGHLAEDPRTLEEAYIATNSGRPESYTYVLELLLLWSDQSKLVTFGIAGVLGMAAGSAAVAVTTGAFRWQGFASTEDLVNHIVGGVLMGFGGVTALGCTIGQGLTGVSTLALGSFLALAAIVTGCVAASKYQVWRLATASA